MTRVPKLSPFFWSQVQGVSPLEFHVLTKGSVSVGNPDLVSKPIGVVPGGSMGLKRGPRAGDPRGAGLVSSELRQLSFPELAGFRLFAPFLEAKVIFDSESMPLQF